MNKTIKIIDLLNKIANGEEVPNKIKIKYKTFTKVEEPNGLLYRNDKEQLDTLKSAFQLFYLERCLNDEVEIIEEDKTFTKEDFIKERMELDRIATRLEFDCKYDVVECNCGMPYCKGFRAIEKEEDKKIEELDTTWDFYDYSSYENFKADIDRALYILKAINKLSKKLSITNVRVNELIDEVNKLKEE